MFLCTDFLVRTGAVKPNHMRFLESRRCLMTGAIFFNCCLSTIDNAPLQSLEECVWSLIIRTAELLGRSLRWTALEFQRLQSENVQ
ncbi:hypothetical protein D918_02059 [Trichuris suis]|nr:hypothetical protein D918_02059 [Trichuris suis]